MQWIEKISMRKVVLDTQYKDEEEDDDDEKKRLNIVTDP